MELLTKLAIDWKLLLAQVVNFAILAVILYRFAYKPVLHALDKRSKMIEKGMADAKASGEKLEHVEKQIEQQLTEAHKQVGAMLEKARKDTDVVKAELVAEAHKNAEDVLTRSRKQMEEEKVAMMSEIRSEVAAIVITATSKILRKEFSADDQKRLLTALAHEMKSVK